MIQQTLIGIFLVMLGVTGAMLAGLRLVERGDTTEFLLLDVGAMLAIGIGLVVMR